MSILLTRDGHRVKVDPEDLHWLRQFKWYVMKHGRNHYVRTGVGPRRSRVNATMHRMIMGLTSRVDGRKLSPLQVDHVNGDGMDNRKQNLRVVSSLQNQQNKIRVKLNKVGLSKYKGVVWDRWRNKWAASIGYDRKKHYLGRFTDEKDAARAYDAAARSIFGKYAHCNLPD